MFYHAAHQYDKLPEEGLQQEAEGQEQAAVRQKYYPIPLHIHICTNHFAESVYLMDTMLYMKNERDSFTGELKQ